MPHSLAQLPTPHLNTELPGPNAKRVIEQDERFTSPSYTRVYPLVVKRGEGCVLEDVDGNRFLDFNAGIAVCATGHSHPHVVAAIKAQADRFLHMSGTDFYYEPQADLAEKLATIAPGNSPKRVFFANSGAEAVEAAIKLARHHTGRQRIIAFHGAFHGRTLGSLSLTASKTIQRRGFGPLLPGVTHVEFPDSYRRPPHRTPEEHADDCLDELEHVVLKKSVPPDEVAAIFVEPIQGEGGYIVPPANFHPRLKSICEQHGMLYVADEVQSGMGRTGKMFAIEHWGVEPDIVCLAKGLASGMPLGAIVAKAEIMDWPPGAHASTFGGNPLCCVASLETIRLLVGQAFQPDRNAVSTSTPQQTPGQAGKPDLRGLTEHAGTVGEYFLAKLRDLQQKHDLIGDVRGKGLMIGVEIVKDRTTKERGVAERNDIVQACFRRGLLLLGCGENTLRLCPPLVVTAEQVDVAVGILDEAIGSVS